jgi:hypothetical protein
MAVRTPWLLAIALTLTAGAARAEPPPVSAELTAEPPPRPWRRAPIATRTGFEVTLGSAVGAAYDDGTRLHAGVRLGAGVSSLRSGRSFWIVAAEVGAARDVGAFGGARGLWTSLRRTRGGTAAIQLGQRGLGISAGPCWRIACLEVGAFGLFTGDRAITVTFTGLCPILTFIRDFRGLD